MPKSTPVPYLEKDQEANLVLSRSKISNEKETQSTIKVRFFLEMVSHELEGLFSFIDQKLELFV